MNASPIYTAPAVMDLETARRIDATLRGAESVVYYLSRPEDDLIKVGKSKALRYRLTGLRKVYGDDCAVLATEPGANWVEDIRHEQFAGLRAPNDGRSGGSEWFRPGPALLAHIEALRTAAVVA